MILVTGATGNVGRPLVELLATAGARVRAITRNPQPALPAGVEFQPDISFTGVSALFLNARATERSFDDLLARARVQGVRRVVVLSAINVDDDVRAQPSRFRGDFNKEAEAAAIGSGLDWVSLRPTIFCSNSIGMWAPQIRAGDTVYGPYAEATSAPIDERDIAGVAARALLGDDLLGRTVELTGPRSLTQREMVGIIGGTIGRSLTYQEVPAEVARQRAIAGMPEGFVDALLRMQAKTVGHPATVTGGVAAILDRPALEYAQWVADHKEAFQP